MFINLLFQRHVDCLHELGQMGIGPLLVVDRLAADRNGEILF